MDKYKIDYLLTPQDVSQIVNENIKVILSSDFGKLKNIDQLIDSKKDIDKALILFRKEHKLVNMNNGGSNEERLKNANEVITKRKNANYKILVNGHYCALMKLGNKLCFYDSYGEFPTDQLKYITPKYREETDQVKNYLADLLINSPYELHYNPHQHQESKKGINTCG